jgi:hypothetical protein
VSKHIRPRREDNNEARTGGDQVHVADQSGAEDDVLEHSGEARPGITIGDRRG